MYRGTAEVDDVGQAVGSVGEALVRLDPNEGRALVELAIKDPTIVAIARTRLEALLTPAKAAPPTNAPADKASPPGKAAPPTSKATSKPAP